MILSQLQKQRNAAYMREWLKDPKHRKDQRESGKRWRKDHPFYYSIYNRGQAKLKKREWAKRYYAVHPTRGERTVQQRKAQSYIERHPELKAIQCELCPEDNIEIDNLQAHHPNYDYPEIIVTCCPSCHKFAQGTFQH